MKVLIFHGSPRLGNTYKASSIFLNELSKCGDIQLSEFYLPKALPEFCTGCQVCFSNPREKCPHSQYVTPIYNAIIDADALIFTTPHVGASTMSSGMKNLLDHLSFFTMTVAPRTEMFNKKAFIITTGTGSKTAIKPIKKFLNHFGVNRVLSLGFRMFIDKWDKMPSRKQAKFASKLKRSAQKFYKLKKKSPCLSTRFMYFISKFVIKRYIGEGNYPYEYWKENGYFKKRPF